MQTKKLLIAGAALVFSYPAMALKGYDESKCEVELKGSFNSKDSTWR